MKTLKEIFFDNQFARFNEKDYKKMYYNLLCDYEMLKSIIDVKHVKPVKGQLRDYQIKTFEYANDFLKIFDKNNLEYFIICGTLLGAIRHKGFVPWDDDFDIGMMRKHYNDLYDFCKNNYIEIDVSKIYFSKNNRHEIWLEYMEKYQNQILFSKTPNHIQIIKGTNLDDVLCLDIFPFDYYDENYSMEEHKKYINEISKKRQNLDNWKDVCDFCDKELENNKNIVEKSNKIFYGIDSLMSYLFYKTFDCWYKTSDVYPIVNIEFENNQLKTINNPSVMCGYLYGDYMQLPEVLTFGEHIHNKILSKENNESEKNILEKLIALIKSKNIKNRGLNVLDFEQYFQEVNAQKQIDTLAKKLKNKKVLLYGAGIYAQTLFSMCDLSKLNIIGVSDKSYAREKIENTPFKSIAPDEIENLDFDEIFTVLYDDSIAIDFIQHKVYKNKNNWNKEIKSLIVPNLKVYFKTFFN